MTIELQMLALSAALGLVQIVLSAHAASFQYGYRWAASARDQAMPPLTGIAARLERTLSNFMETFPLFIAAIVVANVVGRHSWMTAWGAQLYFWGRVAYLPIFFFGVPLVRSMVWNVATIGIVLVLLSLI
jgi:uncharacterized MAPEG superfamily protein